MSKPALRLILGDQLNHFHSWWKEDPKSFTVLIVESKDEATYVTHHIQKVIAFFLAMRNFAEWLESKDFDVKYVALNDKKNAGSIADNVRAELKTDRYTAFHYLLPDEYRLDESLKKLADSIELPVKTFDTEHFYTSRTDVAEMFEGKKTFLMESFYQKMRKKHGILMDGDSPEGGKWNYDKQNRKSLPKEHKVIDAKRFKRDVSELVDLLKAEKIETIGRIDPKNFLWPVTRSEGLAMLRFFIDECLSNFGDYQDAMKRDEWSMYHSRLSFCMNAKLLNPKEVINRVEEAYHNDKKKYNLPAVEGFIRQILGWREYMRGIYWAKMPDYAGLNYFDHKRKLPSWFWDGKTKMNCLSQAVGQSLDYSYAHHIQRLMITGNFALLAGINPDEVDAWYLGIYIDAIEWVEITNTRGMSQFADGGIVGTKPYVSSANYIDKMSDYCSGCHYDKKKKVGEKACPFNSLYWDFYHRHRQKLQNNPRLGFVYPTLDKMDKGKVEEILLQAHAYLENIDEL